MGFTHGGLMLETYSDLNPQRLTPHSRHKISRGSGASALSWAVIFPYNWPSARIFWFRIKGFLKGRLQAAERLFHDLRVQEKALKCHLDEIKVFFPLHIQKKRLLFHSNDISKPFLARIDNEKAFLRPVAYPLKSLFGNPCARPV